MQIRFASDEEGEDHQEEKISAVELFTDGSAVIRGDFETSITLNKEDIQQLKIWNIFG